MRDRKSIIFNQDGIPVEMGGISSDITEQKKAEIKLIELNNTKDKLFSIISHDLKTPFNSLLGVMEILSTEYNNYSDEQRLNYINLTHESAKQTFELLNNLLEWANIQRGHIAFNKESINLKSLVNESIKPYRQNALEKELLVVNNIDQDIFVYADINSMKTIVRNLFNNAVKFSNSGGIVRFYTKQTDRTIELIISDTGIGMSHDILSNLFVIGKNISMPGTNDEMGTGLGLIICKVLITKNDGEIHVESEIAKGTIFNISIPKVKPNSLRKERKNKKRLLRV